MTSARTNKANYGLAHFDSLGPGRDVALAFKLKKKMDSLW